MKWNALSMTAAALAVTFLAGCVPADVPLITSSPLAPKPTESSTPVAESTPTPTVAPVIAATCENLLDPAELALYENGVNPSEEYIAKLRGEDSQPVHFVDYGGVLCWVTGGFHVVRLYGYSAITPDQQAVEMARLAASGYAVSSVDGGTMYTSPDAGNDGNVFFWYFRNGYWWCDREAEQLAEVVAHSPVS